LEIGQSAGGIGIGDWTLNEAGESSGLAPILVDCGMLRHRLKTPPENNVFVFEPQMHVTDSFLVENTA
jgi:hypothetical protein